MLKISITQNATLTNAAEFSSEAELQAWKSYHESIGTFCFEDVYEEIEVEIVPAVIAEDGSEVSPAIKEKQQVLVKAKTHDFVITDVTAEKEAERIKAEKIEAGKKAREACQKVLDYVAGANLDRELTIEQITEMQTLFSQAESALRAGRPTFAKAFISAIEPDETLVTAEIRNTCLELLAGY